MKKKGTIAKRHSISVISLGLYALVISIYIIFKRAMMEKKSKRLQREEKKKNYYDDDDGGDNNHCTKMCARMNNMK